MTEPTTGYGGVQRALQQLEFRVQNVELAAERFAEPKIRLASLQASIEVLLKLTGH
jgi:hypothetical protein